MKYSKTYKQRCGNKTQLSSNELESKQSEFREKDNYLTGIIASEFYLITPEKQKSRWRMPTRMLWSYCHTLIR